MEKKTKSGPRVATPEEMREDALRLPAPTSEEMLAQMKRLKEARQQQEAAARKATAR